MRRNQASSELESARLLSPALGFRAPCAQLKGAKRPVQAANQYVRAEVSTLAAIAAHPLTVACYMRLAETVASPNELAEQFVEDLGKVSYHVRKLNRLGAIEEVESRPVRGATEHFYRAIERPVVTDEEWKRLSMKERLNISRDILQRLVAELSLSLESGTFDARHDRVLIRHPDLDLDEEGWKELNSLVVEMEERTYEIQAGVNARRAGGTSTTSILTTAVYIQFERVSGANAGFKHSK
jgi:hypothetical protein